MLSNRLRKYQTAAEALLEMPRYVRFRLTFTYVRNLLTVNNVKNYIEASRKTEEKDSFVRVTHLISKTVRQIMTQKYPLTFHCFRLLQKLQ